MAEYIEREAAKRAIIEAVDSGLAVTSDDLAEILDDLPAAEAEAVRHGRWQKCSVGKSWWYACSVCGERPGKDWLAFSDSLSDYCPNCGARMDGEEEK